MTWSLAAPALASAFLASIVEVVEAFTIILAVSVLRGWRPAVIGTAAALAVLGVMIPTLGPLLEQVPIEVLQLTIGILLLLFGLGWLRKAVLRAAGVLPLHDETAIFATESAALQRGRSEAWIGGIAAFKAVLLEGLEVVFIVIAIGTGRGMLLPAAIGALAACAAVLLVGLLIRKPLSRVPENQLKFAVGTMLSAFGVFWTGEGLGIDWPGSDAALLLFMALFLLVGLATAAVLKRRSTVMEVAR